MSISVGDPLQMHWGYKSEIKTEPQDTQSNSDGFHSAESAPNSPSSEENNENSSQTVYNTQQFYQAAPFGINVGEHPERAHAINFDPQFVAQMYALQRYFLSQANSHTCLSRQSYMTQQHSNNHNQDYMTSVNAMAQITGTPQINGSTEYHRSMYPTPNVNETSIMIDDSRISDTPPTSKTPAPQYQANNLTLVPSPTTALNSLNLSPSRSIAHPTPPRSPGSSGQAVDIKTLEESDASSHCDSEKFNNPSDTQNKSYDFKLEWENLSDEYTKPTFNAHGKVKTFTCKVCGFRANIKVEFWEHSRLHMKQEKILQCKTCPFVTEYKHHMEYHNRQHTGEKPYKCDQCDYKCVNKSMLMSHFKSHSNIYQYSCMDCDHVAKYCHSMKLHCQKKKHRPAMVLNEDGTVNPNPIIDVYGRRRGPKPKKNPKVIIMEQRDPDTLPSYTITAPVAIPAISFKDQSTSKSTAPLQIPNTSALIPKMVQIQLDNINAQLAVQANAAVSIKTENWQDQSYQSVTDNKNASEINDVLDLSVKHKANNSPITIPQVKLPAELKRNRRKGRAVKLVFPEKQDDSDSNEEFPETEENETNNNSVCTLATKHSPMEVEESFSKLDCVCTVCGITFIDKVLYDHHMSYHGLRNPLTCNMCGESYNDARSFNVHLIRVRH